MSKWRNDETLRTFRSCENETRTGENPVFDTNFRTHGPTGRGNGLKSRLVQVRILLRVMRTNAERPEQLVFQANLSGFKPRRPYQLYVERSLNGKAPHCECGLCGFKSRHPTQTMGSKHKGCAPDCLSGKCGFKSRRPRQIQRLDS